MDSRFRIEEVAIVKGDRGEQLLELYGVIPEEWLLKKDCEHDSIKVIKKMINNNTLKCGVVMGTDIIREKVAYFDFDLKVIYANNHRYNFDGVVFTFEHSIDSDFPLDFFYICNDKIKEMLKEQLLLINHASVTLKFQKYILAFNRINLFHCNDPRRLR